jgi:hypothetical protein
MGSSPHLPDRRGWWAAPRVDLWARLFGSGRAGILYRGGPSYQSRILVAHAELGAVAFSVPRRRRDRARRRASPRR